jgi:hypothetical protein
MQTPIKLSLAAGLTVVGIGAAAAGTDPCVWRYYVSAALRAQQDAAPPAPLLLREGRASAIDGEDRFRPSHERYFAEGSPAPAADGAQR